LRSPEDDEGRMSLMNEKHQCVEFFQCFDAVGWLTKNASGPQNTVTPISEVLFQSRKRKRTEETS